MTVADLLDRTSAHELAEWEAYFLLEQEAAGGVSGGRSRITDPDEMLSAFRALGGLQRGDNR